MDPDIYEWNWEHEISVAIDLLEMVFLERLQINLTMSFVRMVLKFCLAECYQLLVPHVEEPVIYLFFYF